MGDIALLYVACFALDMHITHTHRTYPMYITQQHTLPGTATGTHTYIAAGTQTEAPHL